TSACATSTTTPTPTPARTPASPRATACPSSTARRSPRGSPPGRTPEMCGRFAFFQEIDPLLDDLGAVDLEDPRLRSRWNIPPTAPIHVVTESIDKETGEVLRALRVARWGLLPPFAKDESFSSRTFNARRETLGEKPRFRGSLSRYRAIVPMAGYYEWVRDEKGKRKQRYFIGPGDGTPLYMAALVSWWKGPGGHEGPAASEDGAFLLATPIITRA